MSASMRRKTLLPDPDAPVTAMQVPSSTEMLKGPVQALRKAFICRLMAGLA